MSVAVHSDVPNRVTKTSARKQKRNRRRLTYIRAYIYRYMGMHARCAVVDELARGGRVSELREPMSELRASACGVF